MPMVVKRIHAKKEDAERGKVPQPASCRYTRLQQERNRDPSPRKGVKKIRMRIKSSHLASGDELSKAQLVQLLAQGRRRESRRNRRQGTPVLESSSDDSSTCSSLSASSSTSESLHSKNAMHCKGVVCRSRPRRSSGRMVGVSKDCMLRDGEELSKEQLIKLLTEGGKRQERLSRRRLQQQKEEDTKSVRSSFTARSKRSVRSGLASVKRVLQRVTFQRGKTLPPRDDERSVQSSLVSNDDVDGPEFDCTEEDICAKPLVFDDDDDNNNFELPEFVCFPADFVQPRHKQLVSL